jgi:hypothetical protein
MAELKTRPTDASVEEFLNKVEDDKKRKDAFDLLEIFKKVTGEEPKMWGDSIVGFGTYTYKYANGKELEWMECGFSPRKQNLTVYIMTGFDGFGEALSKLGKHKTGKSCLYIKRLEDIDQAVLEKMIAESVAWFRNRKA